MCINARGPHTLVVIVGLPVLCYRELGDLSDLLEARLAAGLVTSCLGCSPINVHLTGKPTCG